MNNLKKIILSSFLVLSCNDTPLCIDTAGEEKGIVSEKEAFVMLKEYVKKSGIELHEEHKPIKIQNLAPWVVSVKKQGLNPFKISDYSKYVDQSDEYDFYSYYIEDEGRHVLISPYTGVIIEGNIQKDFFYPDDASFLLDDGSFCFMTISYSEEKTLFCIDDSCVVVQNNTAGNPFILDECCVDIESINNIVSSLKMQTALPFFKYFYDCAAAQKGAGIVYLDENYFSPKFNILGRFYIDINGELEVIGARLQQYQEQMLRSRGSNVLSFMKIFIEYPSKISGLQLAAVKHTILLALYQDQWFIVDSNGGNASYYRDSNFVKALEGTRIRLCENCFYGQVGNGCDTCASMNMLFLSSYVAENGKLDFTGSGDIDFEKIFYFAISKEWLPRPKFFVLKSFS